MSYVCIYTVRPNGDVSHLSEAKNNHGFAPLVWEKLTQQYGLHPTGKPYDLTPRWNYDPLWSLRGTGKLERGDDLLLGVTFDRVWIGRALVPDLLQAMRAFHVRHIVPNNYVHTIAQAADILEQDWMVQCPDDRGIAFNMCSANDSFWGGVRTEDGYRNYNIDHDSNGHWELT